MSSRFRNTIKSALARYRLNKVKPVQFQWKSDNKSMTGFVAQQIPSNIGTIVPNNNIHFNSGKSNADPILTITGDGDVVWNGKPSEAADILVRTFQLKVESTKGVTNAARRRYYLQACQNLLKAAEQMEYEEFIAFLNRQVYNREHTIIMEALKGEQE